MLDAVTVRSYGRLHFGLLQMSQDHPRQNMGLGGCIDSEFWTIEVSRKESGTRPFVLEGVANPAWADELQQVGHALLERLAGDHPEIPRAIRVRVIDSIPMHSGLGSKTSFLRGLLFALCRLGGVEDWTRELHQMRRGGTSGIGVNLAPKGGLVLDAGHAVEKSQFAFGTSRTRAGAPLPRVVCQWRDLEHPMLLVRPLKLLGPSGACEQRIFDEGVPISKSETDEIAGVVLYQILPALAEGDEPAMHVGLKRLQDLGFKKLEWAVQAPRVHALRDAAMTQGATCVALSSMGPTMAVFGEDLGGISRLLGNMFADVDLKLARFHSPAVLEVP